MTTTLTAEQRKQLVEWMADRRVDTDIDSQERTYRNLNRYRQILTVFFKYGFGDLVEHLKIEQYIEIGLQMVSKKRRERVERFSRAERVRMALEELGPTYIKLGQILSTRPDLVPADFIKELAKLQDKVPPYPFTEFMRILEDHLGGPIDTYFTGVDETPLASASIGQVHRGRLTSGDEVAIKIQRPGIHRTVEVDLEIMLHLATLMERHIEEIALHRPVKIVEEFARLITLEMGTYLGPGALEKGVDVGVSSWHRMAPNTYPAAAKISG